MVNPFSKDGIITKVTEALPGGGFITGPIHAAAGNQYHAVQAAIAGFGTVAALPLGPAASTVVGAGTAGLSGIFDQMGLTAIAGFGTVAAWPLGPTASVIAGAGTAGLSAIFEQMGLSDDKKHESVSAAERGDYEGATRVLLEAASVKIADNSRELSAESGGRRSLKSIHGTYLRAYDNEWKADLTSGPPREWERWYVEDWGGKVVFKAIHNPGRFLRAHPDGGVDLVDRPQDWETWKPFKNDDGSWSFLSVHGRWLSGRQDGSISTVERCNEWEHFWLEWW
uniref:Uncharacterized protein n=1 Tax=Panagrolaimus sp. JU765 TaxID=591449 RepID=A0AC34RR31_9BILA